MVQMIREMRTITSLAVLSAAMLLPGGSVGYGLSRCDNAPLPRAPLVA